MRIELALRSLQLDARRITKAYLDAERQVLTKAAVRGRKLARAAMRKRKRASKPGEAPTVRMGQLKRFLLFAYEPEKHVAIFGPKKLEGGQKDTPEIMEKGGSATRVVGRGRFRRKKAINYKKRPAMVPALDKISPDLPAMWTNAIR